MNKNIQMQSKKRGLALPLVLCAVLILAILGIGLLTLGYQTRLRAIKTSSEIAARCAADAGLTKALYDMNIKLQTKPWNDSSLPSASNVALPGSNLIYSYNITKDGSGIYTIASTGNYGSMQKQVTCTLTVDGVFDYPIFGDASVKLYNSSTVDQYNTDPCTPTLTVGTNGIASGTVSLKNSSMINGNVIVGVGGNPATVISNLGGTITGSQSAMPVPNTLKSVTVPSSLSSQATKGTLSSGTVTASAKYTTVNLATNGAVTIQGPVSLYITGNSTLGNSAQIIIDNSVANSSLTLYLGGNLTSNNGSGINNQTQNPKKTVIYGLNTCTAIGLKNNGAMYGAIYAPKAAVTYNNGVPLYGSVVAKSFETKNSAAIHYDASLRNVTVNDDLVTFKVKTWNEN